MTRARAKLIAGFTAAGAIALAACSRPVSHLEAKQTYDYTCTDTCKLHISTGIDVPMVSCAGGMDLAEAPDGKAIGYRCHAGPLSDENTWAAVRLRGGTRFIDDCSAPLGNAAAPNFAALGKVESAEIRLVDCAKSAPVVWSEVAKSVQEESGSNAAASFEIQTSLRPPTATYAQLPSYVDGWVQAFGQIDPIAQATVRAEICPAIGNVLTSPVLFMRAVRTCPLGDATPDMLRWMHDALSAPAPDFVRERVTNATDPPAELNPSELALATAASIAVSANPKAASSIACTAIEKLSREGDPVRVAIAASVIALSKTRCAALESYTPLWPCDLESPIKTKTAEAVSKLVWKPGTLPIVPSANYAMFEALTIGGILPAGYADRKADGGFLGGFCP